MQTTKLYLFIAAIAFFLTACATKPEKHRAEPTETAVGLAGKHLPAAHPLTLPQTLQAGQDNNSNATPKTAAPAKEVNNPGSLPAMQHFRESEPRPLAQYFPPGQDTVQMDYEQVELRKIIEELSDLLGLSVVIDSSIADKITLRTAPDNPLKPADIWPTLQLLLSDSGISMEKKGKIYHLRKSKAPLPDNIGGLGTGLEHSTSPQVMQITPLRYISQESGLTALKPLVEPEGRIISLPTLNLLGIITSPPRLQRVNSLLGLIDTDPFVHRGMRLFRLDNAKASEVQGELDKILKAVEGNTPSYQIISLERINALLVIGPPRRGFGEVERWVKILDEKNEEGGEQVFIYRVRNLEAGKLATTLSEVFRLDDEDKLRNRNKQDNDNKTNNTPNQNPTNPFQQAQERNASKKSETGNGAGISAELKVTIVADEDTNTLLIRTRPRDYRQLLETIAILDQVPKEVMVNVVIAEVGLNETTRFGIEWSSLFGGRDNFVGTAFDVRGGSSGTGAEFSTGTLSGLVINQVGGRISSILNAIATDNDTQVLSRPSILVRNNQEATVNVGSDEPTITRLNTTTQNTAANTFTSSNEVQYRQTGIILKVTPHINEDGIINMDVSQEVSKPGELRTEQQLPSFDNRKIETSVLVRDNDAIILGGLIQTNIDNQLQGIPGLMDVPLLGHLFSSTGKVYDRTELVVIIVPQIIDPQADNHAFVEAFQSRMQAVSKLLNEEYIPILPFTRKKPVPPKEHLSAE